MLLANVSVENGGLLVPQPMSGYRFEDKEMADNKWSFKKYEKSLILAKELIFGYRQSTYQSLMIKQISSPYPFILLFFLFISSTNVAQNLSWAAQMAGIQTKEIKDGAVDNEGNIYTVGTFEGVVDFDPSPGALNLNAGGFYANDIFITKQSPDGGLIWVKQIGSAQFDVARSIAITSPGDIVIAGTFNGVVDFDPGTGVFNMTSTNGNDIFILKLTSSGSFIWAKQISTTAVAIEAPFTHIGTDNSGNIIMAVSFKFPYDFDPGTGTAILTPTAGSFDIALCKLSSAGNFLWIKQVGNADVNLANSVKVDNNGNILYVGYINNIMDFDPGPGVFNLGTASDFSAFVAKLNTSGDFVWAKKIDNVHKAIDIELDPSNNSYIISDHIYDHDSYISKFSQDGNHQWTKSLISPPTIGSVEGKSVEVDREGNVLIACNFSFRADFDPGPAIFNLISYGSDDIAIAKYTSNGDMLWAKNMGGTSFDTPAFMILDPTDKMIIGGQFSHRVDFDPGLDTSNLISLGTYPNGDMFVAKYFKANNIAGKIFKDNNGDGIQQPNEPPLQNVMVKSATGVQNYYGISDSNGKYRIATDTGAYFISSIMPLYYNSSIPVSHNAVFGSITGQFDTANNFGLQALSITKDLRVTITNLAAARPGFSTSYRITYANIGTDTLSGDLLLTHDSRLAFTTSAPLPNNYAFPILRYDYVNLPPSMSRNIDVNFLVSTSVLNGTVLKTYLTGSPIVNDFNPDNNIDSLYHVVTGSYDPNDKTVRPNGDITTDFINAGKFLDYTIRFQNTGTDTAFTVLIRDSLSNNLEFSSFETLTASHQYAVDLKENNIVEWRFNNILLPDSNINEPRSHGFVRYRIRPKSALVVGSQIKNKAAIYFDYNLPVMTNETVNAVTVITSVNPGATEIGSKVFPNPANSILHLRAKGYFYYTVYDVAGKMIIGSTKEYNEADLNVSIFVKGIYFIEIKNSKGKSVHKIVIN